MKKFMGKGSLVVMAALAAASASAALQIVPAPRKVVEGEGVFICKGDAASAMSFKTDPAIPNEGYRLSVTKDGIAVAASDDAGRYYALVTLTQLAEADGKDGTKYPCVEIEDSPRYSWRGFHLDECRHFFGL